MKWDIDAILLMFANILLQIDRKNLEDLNLMEIFTCVQEFYKSLERCQIYLNDALRQFLI